MKDTADLMALKECYEHIKHQGYVTRTWSLPDVREIYYEDSLAVMLIKHIYDNFVVLEAVIQQDIEKKIAEGSNG